MNVSAPPPQATPAAPAPAMPAISVVVPSYNRRASLEAVLVGLAAQRGVAPGAFEVLVVLDGSTDSSAAMLAEWVADGRVPGLRWQLQPNGGQAAARDAGSRAAAAPVLLFIDDDVVPEPDLVARHLAWHAAGERVAVLGDCEIVRGPDAGFYQKFVWSWWEELYASRVRPGRLPCYVDFCAGNVSLRREDYLASGGFDPRFRGYGGEDYDLGYRLLQRGVRFVADRGARAMHHHRFTGYPGFLRSRRQEGHADVLLGRKHPELRAGLRVAQAHTLDPPYDRAARLAFTAPGMPAWAVRARVARVALNERLGRRAHWASQLDVLGRYHYWRGVYEVLGSWDALLAFRAEATLPVQAVDVTRGLAEVPAGFWVHGPSDVRVTAGGTLVGVARLRGPVTRPIAEALADVIDRQLALPLLLWADRAGAPLLPPLDTPLGTPRDAP